MKEHEVKGPSTFICCSHEHPTWPLDKRAVLSFLMIGAVLRAGGGWWRGQFEIALPALRFRRQQSSCFNLLQYIFSMRESWLNLMNVGCTPLLVAWSWLILGAHTRQADIEPWLTMNAFELFWCHFGSRLKPPMQNGSADKWLRSFMHPWRWTYSRTGAVRCWFHVKLALWLWLIARMSHSWLLDCKCIKIWERLDDCQSFTCLQGMQYGKIIFQHISRRCLFQRASWWSCGSPRSDSLCAYIYVDVSWCAWLGR